MKSETIQSEKTDSNKLKVVKGLLEIAMLDQMIALSKTQETLPREEALKNAKIEETDADAISLAKIHNIPPKDVADILTELATKTTNRFYDKIS